ncbi:hypothetical protein SEA_DIMINIMUS_150 [Mycobacterium phage Diminimus]|uniref:Uncharacterized protein n=3 Tax=Bongovirus bongo TaxID=1983750 RepID=A0A0M3UKF0_9CAUD|nr:hypothetical protein PEGLEG_153 [Mycobacterium phage PegLeg]ALF00661.1 hypothetical protein SEA_BRICOLE_155 [Mycobacterium phage Bricole]QDH93705.1 hypothetical protein SEA_LILHOMIEP_149 [Mycobacterium phage LilhomieP]QUU29333.1 hypothetical protein [Mycobacterium phage SirSheldon]WNN95706.1 hypothetical protein SEA_GLASKE16_152 [Mycobacterium phage Glaske16]WNN96274.1 hypothetical protein SEA_DULCITA_150 [Mycobacterium phage Dulcita]WNO28218.1 hypothetical protein SEA_DIMINIMUS_150 [Mycob
MAEIKIVNGIEIYAHEFSHGQWAIVDGRAVEIEDTQVHGDTVEVEFWEWHGHTKTPRLVYLSRTTKLQSLYFKLS